MSNTYRKHDSFTVLEIISPKHGLVEFIIDSEDVPRIKAHTWNVNTNRGRLIAKASLSYYENGKTKSSVIQLHRLVTSFDSEIIDHANCNPQDNRKSNLRAATNAQNSRNSKTPRSNKSGYKGVSTYKRYGNFQAIIGFEMKKIFLGYFDTAIDAANAYDKAAIKYHGKFAKLNNPKPTMAVG